MQVTYAKVSGNNHGDYQYELGLNVLDGPFDASPRCGSGGLYFCRIQDVLKWVDYGDTVCVVEPAEDAQVVKVDNTYQTKYKTDRLVVRSMHSLHDVKTLVYLEEQGVDIFSEHGIVLALCASRLGLKPIQYLLDRGVCVHSCEDYAVRRASECGDLKMVQYLVMRGANPRVRDEHALRWAAIKGHLDVVKYLVEDCGAHQQRIGEWLRYVALHGRADVLRYLVEEHGCKDLEAVTFASANNHVGVVEYLNQKWFQ